MSFKLKILLVFIFASSIIASILSEEFTDSNKENNVNIKFDEVSETLHDEFNIFINNLVASINSGSIDESLFAEYINLNGLIISKKSFVNKFNEDESLNDAFYSRSGGPCSFISTGRPIREVLSEYSDSLSATVGKLESGYSIAFSKSNSVMPNDGCLLISQIIFASKINDKILISGFNYKENPKNLISLDLSDTSPKSDMTYLHEGNSILYYSHNNFNALSEYNSLQIFVSKSQQWEIICNGNDCVNKMISIDLNNLENEIMSRRNAWKNAHEQVTEGHLILYENYSLLKKQKLVSNMYGGIFTLMYKEPDFYYLLLHIE